MSTAAPPRSRTSIVGERAPVFWGGCVAISLGVLSHLPMLAMAHDMGGHIAGMPMDPSMWAGMVLIVLGVPAAASRPTGSTTPAPIRQGASGSDRWTTASAR